MPIAQFTTRRPVASAVVFLAAILLDSASFARLLEWATCRDVGPAEIDEFVTIPVQGGGINLGMLAFGA